MTGEYIDLNQARQKRDPEPRIKLVPFDKVKLTSDRRYLVKGLIPYPGLSLIWGAPKTGKSFWTFDLVMHVALGREYRGRRVQEGTVVYCCFEGQSGITARIEAFRQRFLPEDCDPVPFYLQPVTLDLIKECPELIAAIRSLGETPVVVVLDTLNRSLVGSESSDADMAAYIRAADAIREAFDCSVLIVHHCGWNETRFRGHSSLGGALDAELSVKRDLTDAILVSVVSMKEGPTGTTIVSRLDPLEVGVDADGDPIPSCVVVPAEAEERTSETRIKLSANQQTMLAVLQTAKRPLSADEWTEKAKEAGIITKRHATYWDLRTKLHEKGFVYEGANGWLPK